MRFRFPARSIPLRLNIYPSMLRMIQRRLQAFFHAIHPLPLQAPPESPDIQILSPGSPPPPRVFPSFPPHHPATPSPPHACPPLPTNYRSLKPYSVYREDSEF